MEMKVLMVLVGLVALASAIPGTQSCDKKRQRVWIIAGGGNYGTEDLIKPDTGAVCGWGSAIVKAACAAAGIHCRIVFAPYSHCLVQNDPTPSAHHRLGRALELGSVHACYGWFPNPERRDVVIFSDGYMFREPFRLLHKANAPPRFSRTDVRIAFYSATGDEYCLRRLLRRAGVRLRDFSRQVTFVDAGNAEAHARQGNSYDLVFDSWREAALSGNVNLDDLRTYDINNDGNTRDDFISCAEGDGGIMARVDHWELIDAFNYGLRVIRDNGVFQQICEDPKWDESNTKSAFHVTWCSGV